MDSNASITTSITLKLPSHLLRSLEDAAQSQGVSPDHLMVDLLSREFDPLHQQGAGRCSLRTGLCSEGPTPLPLQQP
ncbi:MAG: hypothetical protein VKL23_08095 [Cyanobacteriota bacterium]|jgi:hypothetical protein|nr:hypothetical protein [Cyanobacteriota bacterium]